LESQFLPHLAECKELVSLRRWMEDKSSGTEKGCLVYELSDSLDNLGDSGRPREI
jgi:hypothetical protein